MLGAALAVSATALAGTPAAADEASPDVDAKKYAPACVYRHQIDGSPKFIVVQNNCGRTMRLNVHIAAWPDTGCKTYTAGQRRTFIIPSIANYQTTVTC